MPKTDDVVEFGNCTFDSKRQELKTRGFRVRLSASQIRLLTLFLERPGELITRDEIRDRIWTDTSTIDVERGINTAINRLRANLGDNPDKPAYIETLISQGYRFIANVAAIHAPSEPATKEAATPGMRPQVWEPPASPLPEIPPAAIPSTQKTRPFWAVACAIALLGLLGAGGAWKWRAGDANGHALNAAAPSLEILDDDVFHSLHPVAFGDPETSFTAQAVSPSGKLLAWSDQKSIFVRSLESENTRALAVPDGLKVTKLSWFADESSLLMSGSPRQTDNTFPLSSDNSQLWQISLTGEGGRLLAKDAVLGVVSSDGKNIAYMRTGQTEVWVASLDGSSSHKLFEATNGNVFTCLLWSEDSGKLLTTRVAAATDSMSHLNTGDEKGVAKSSAPSGSTYEAHDLASGKVLAQADGVRFTSAALLNGGRLAYFIKPAHNLLHLAIIDIDAKTGALTSPPRIVSLEKVFPDTAPESPDELSASSDGRTMSLLLDYSGMDFFVADLAWDASRSRPTLEHIKRPSIHGPLVFPTAWSPDGKTILFDSGYHGPNSVLGQSIDGSHTVTYAGARSSNDRFAQAHYSPDGRWVLYLRMPQDSRANIIERVPVAGGMSEVVTASGTIENFSCSRGEHGRCVLREHDGHNALVYYDLDPIRGMGAELARVPYQPNILGDWSLSPDGSKLAIANHDPAHPGIKLLTLPTTPGTNQPPQVRDIPVQGFGTVLGPGWASDGRGLFLETTKESNYNLLYMDIAGHATLLRKSRDLIWAVPSPDGKHIAFPEAATPSRNLWVGATPFDLTH